MTEVNAADCCVHNLVKEYQSSLNGQVGVSALESMRSALITQHDWTPLGAQHVTDLANNYGVMVLRNALAVALALGIEDGVFGL